MCASARGRANKLCNPAPLAIDYALVMLQLYWVTSRRDAVSVFSPDYLAEPLTPDPLPTKDSGVLRTYLERPRHCPV